MVEYVERFYRKTVKPSDLISFDVKIKESDLMIYAHSDLSQFSYSLLDKERRSLEAYIRYKPQFQESLVPIDVDDFAPPICKIMAESVKKARVGPMAAVAGAVNDRLANELLSKTTELIIENGGDLFIRSLRERVIAIYVGENSPFKSHIGLLISPGKTYGVATSSGKIGHSLSFGEADAVTIVAHSSSVADAWATSIGNLIHSKKDVEKALKYCENIQEIIGVVVVFQDVLGVRGDIQLVNP
ncbi:MAG: UPF0280 family protein [Atribacter sp.]|jgi:ApbE superfamily uncharacterized protein (UPF0280 family)|uniref:UPF0280 family protein n=1 Tax=Atribacter sp. TaxID=2847780 RepID=UPI003D96380F|nr:UPF0280 family protein [Atribacterota bacterium]